MDGAPVIAVLTARGAGGIAVVAIKGPARHGLAGRWLRAPGSGGPLGGLGAAASARAPRVARLVLDDGVVVDRVLVVDRPDLEQIEIHMHGSEAVLATLAAAAPVGSIAPSDSAERLLRSALGPAQLALALEQTALGPFARFVERVCREPRPATRAAQRAAARRRSTIALALAEPARLVLCGAQNAGKSTLMNRLLFRERVLTGTTRGLTRDPIRECAVLDGYPYEIVDTAGEGAVAAEPDRMALARARAARAETGILTVLVVDGERGFEGPDQALAKAATLILRNKIDRPQGRWPAEVRCDLQFAARDPARSAEIRTAVGVALRARRGLPPAGPVGGPAALSRAEFELLVGAC